LSDGEPLVLQKGFVETQTRFADDSPPTLMMDQPRVTNPIDWASGSPAQWPNQSISPITPQFGMAAYGQPQNTTLPTFSLVLGIGSLVFACCFAGIWLGVPAAIFGFVAMRNIERDPNRYSGRGMAIGGMVVGIVTFLGTVFFILLMGLS